MTSCDGQPNLLSSIHMTFTELPKSLGGRGHLGDRKCFILLAQLIMPHLLLQSIFGKTSNCLLAQHQHICSCFFSVILTIPASLYLNIPN